MFGKVKFPFDFTDCMIIAGGGLVCYGVYQVYPPASFIILGAGLIYWAIQIERGRPNGKPS